MHIDLTDLRLFLHVIEAGSITHGAAGMNLSLAAASERLRNMEEANGIMLLQRGRRGVTPTEAGEALAHHARQILRRMDLLQDELGEFSGGVRATVRLLANTSAMAEFLPERLGPWLASHPGVDVDLRERQSADIIKAIAGRLADIGIVSGAVDPGVLQLRPFAIDRLVVVAAHNHPLAGSERVAFADIMRHQFVGLAVGSALQDYIEGHAMRLGGKLRLRVRMRSFEGICRLAAQNIGIGIVPLTAARRCRRAMRKESGGLSIIRLQDGWATRKLWLCCTALDELPPLARDLITHLEQ